MGPILGIRGYLADDRDRLRQLADNICAASR
jgi:hypothetical protein